MVFNGYKNKSDLFASEILYNLTVPCRCCKVTFNSLSPKRERVRVKEIRIDILPFVTPSRF
jgi:hypothetical protein